MNIYLIPHNWTRHLSVGWVVAIGALLCWGGLVFFWVVVNPWLMGFFGVCFARSCEGPFFIGALSATMAFTSLMAEGMLLRRSLRWRWLWALLAGMGAAIPAMMFYGLWVWVHPYFFSAELRSVLNDGSLTTLRFRLPLWLFGGYCAGLSTFFVRRFRIGFARKFQWGVDGRVIRNELAWGGWFLEAFTHVGGGLIGAGLGASIWHLFGHTPLLGGNLFTGAALGITVWGFVHGALAWPVSEDLYAGWVRVLSAERFGLRIPIPNAGGSKSERFIGHFPRGLDLYLPADRGVAELHTSFVVDEEGRYAVRGLSVAPTTVKRFLEEVDLRYDPHRPAPLETSLRMEDRIRLGQHHETELEFLLLPKEES